MARYALPIRFMGVKAEYGGDSLYNRSVLVNADRYNVGALEAHFLHPNTTANNTTITDSWQYKFGGTSSSPKLLKKLEVINRVGLPITFSLGMRTSTTGTPTASQSFLVWLTALATNTTFSWEGEVPLIGRYIFVTASVADSAVLYYELQDITPA
jgi:hypothetical protein